MLFVFQAGCVLIGGAVWAVSASTEYVAWPYSFVKAGKNGLVTRGGAVGGCSGRVTGVIGCAAGILPVVNDWPNSLVVEFRLGRVRFAAITRHSPELISSALLACR